MKAGTARTIALVLAAVFLGGLLLLSLMGDDEARRALPSQLAVWATIGALFFAGYWFRVRPRRDLHRAEAAALRLRSASGDPFGVLDRGFVLLGQFATAKDVENTSWGTWRGRDVVVFDYWFARSSDPQRADHQHFACATTTIPSTWPDLAIVPRRVLGRLEDALGPRALRFELERFNRTFDVSSADPHFASALIDAAMIEWLLGFPEGTGFELRRSTALAMIPHPTLDHVPRVLETLDDFLRRVPRVVASLYPDRA
jgi:hypothetical protein